MFILICRYNHVFAYPGDDVTLSSHLSPETSAVSMEVRWFRGTECIYLYKNGQVSVGTGYEGRASLLSSELKRGNVSLSLKSIAPVDTGTYTCQVLTGQIMVEKSIHLYMSGMEPLSPERTGPTLTEKDNMDMQESVLILELKKLLQLREKELQDKTRELETTTEMLRTKSSLLLYTDMDLENVSKLANQKEEHLKSKLNELEMCKRRLETLERKLLEKNTQVEELRVILQDKERELWESKEQHITEGLKNTEHDAADTEESVHLVELRNLLKNKEQELEDKTKQLTSTTEKLTRTAKLLQDRDADLEKLERERDVDMAGEMEMCLRELETLGQKLQEKDAEVEELRSIAQGKERELKSERVITVNKTAHEPFVFELLEKSDDLLSRMYQDPKEQLEDIESWIYKKREDRRLREEEERTAVLENEFLDYVSAVKELIGKKHEKIVAWAKMTAVLQSKLEVLKTDEERQALEMQVKEAAEMQRQGQEQIERLTEGIEEKRTGIEEKHKHEIEEIRDKYSTMSKIAAERNILKIILPDVQAYFRNTAADLKALLDAQSQITGETGNPDSANLDRVEAENHTDGPVEQEVTTQTEVHVEAVCSVKSSPEINNNCVEMLVHPEAEAEAEAEAELHVTRERQADDFTNDEASDDSQDDSNNMVNGVITEEEEEEEEEQEEVWELNEHVETRQEDMVDTQ